MVIVDLLFAIAMQLSEEMHTQLGNRLQQLVAQFASHRS